ncbi:hypothetical protein CABS01_16429 [Colletotrichum abscissum]|uniref:uncharacterized protein n=1 Tax=Colletotrichum abscissum TaxID=1671311 RepID=UPI0027D4C2EF|nr:uncharacterized protein CABS01_16429 [Colletotrichum abscissum]KAK1471214.1 hypothetical protein CABS01_16429 [Colletotrichum abscissum]
MTTSAVTPTKPFWSIGLGIFLLVLTLSIALSLLPLLVVHYQHAVEAVLHVKISAFLVIAFYIAEYLQKMFAKYLQLVLDSVVYGALIQQPVTDGKSARAMRKSDSLNTILKVVLLKGLPTTLTAMATFKQLGYPLVWAFAFPLAMLLAICVIWTTFLSSLWEETLSAKADRDDMMEYFESVSKIQASNKSEFPINLHEVLGALQQPKSLGLTETELSNLSMESFTGRVKTRRNELQQAYIESQVKRYHAFIGWTTSQLFVGILAFVSVLRHDTEAVILCGRLGHQVSSLDDGCEKIAQSFPKAFQILKAMEDAGGIWLRLREGSDQASNALFDALRLGRVSSNNSGIQIKKVHLRNNSSPTYGTVNHSAEWA